MSLIAFFSQACWFVPRYILLPVFRAGGSYLGRSLSKKQQTSRWARRPLLDAQITYAACDALGGCLVCVCVCVCFVLHGTRGLDPVDESLKRRFRSSSVWV